MSDFFLDLKKKYNYSDDFIYILNKIIDALISYYGDGMKDKILSKISSVNIHIKQDGEDSDLFISNYLGVYENHLPYDDVLGYATTRPIYKDGKLNFKSIIYLSNTINSEDIMSYSILVHELCHLVKQRDFYVKNDKIYGGTGLQVEVYNLNGKLLDRFYSSLEEASNSYDECNVMNILTNSNYNLWDRKSNYAYGMQFYVELIKYMEKYDKDFSDKVISSGIEYLNSLFSLYGIQILNCFFDMCVDLNSKKNLDSSIDDGKLYELFYILKKSFDGMIKVEEYDF